MRQENQITKSLLQWAPALLVSVLAAATLLPPETLAEHVIRPRCSATVTAAEDRTKLDVPARSLFLPLYQVDASDPTGITTFFAIRNRLPDALTVERSYYDRGSTLLYAETTVLDPGETVTKNLREIEGLVADADGIARGWVSVEAVEAAEVPGKATPSCSGGEVYDDGSFENGYAPSSTSLLGGLAMRMNAPRAGLTIEQACVCFQRLDLSDTSIAFYVEVYEADATGEPGDKLHEAGPFVASDVPFGLTGQFYSVDFGSTDLVLPEGDFFLAVTWSRLIEGDIYLCADESVTTPKQPGYGSNTTLLWSELGTVSNLPEYRALGLRADFALATVASVTGDYFFVDWANNFASGDRLATSDELCDEAEIRFVDFGAGAALSVYLTEPQGANPDTDPPSALVTVVNEAGESLGSFDLFTNATVVPLQASDFVTETGFGSLIFDFSPAGGGLVSAEYNAHGKFSVALNGTCVTPHASEEAAKRLPALGGGASGEVPRADFEAARPRQHE